MRIIRHGQFTEGRKIGRYSVNEKLTKLLNVPGWVIYRDPSVGLYCSPEDEDSEYEEFDTGYYSAVQITKMDWFLTDCRDTIQKQVQEYE